MARQVFGHWLFSNVESHVDPGFSQLSYFYMVPVSLLIYVSIRVRSYANWRCLRHARAHAKSRSAKHEYMLNLEPCLFLAPRGIKDGNMFERRRRLAELDHVCHM